MPNCVVGNLYTVGQAECMTRITLCENTHSLMGKINHLRVHISNISMVLAIFVKVKFRKTEGWHV